MPDLRMDEVNVVLNPVSLDGACSNNQKVSKEIMTIGRLIEIGSITEEAADFLENL